MLILLLFLVRGNPDRSGGGDDDDYCYLACVHLHTIAFPVMMLLLLLLVVVVMMILLLPSLYTFAYHCLYNTAPV